GAGEAGAVGRLDHAGGAAHPGHARCGDGGLGAPARPRHPGPRHPAPHGSSRDQPAPAGAHRRARERARRRPARRAFGDRMTDTERLRRLDAAHVWHPFTQMQGWAEEGAPIIESGEGMYLVDTEGRRYLDGVSSLWCNVHGHGVPEIDAAIREQLDRIAHTTL